MKEKHNHLGKKFYKLTVIDKEEVYNGHYKWICLCECGNKIKICGAELTKGHKKSCGCWRKKRTSYEPVEQRFLKFTEKTNSCWLWKGYKVKYKNYESGYMSYKGKPQRSSRVSYELHKGIIPKGLYVCHTCDNGLCVNPDHLFLGTQKDNMQDMWKKNRGNPCRGSKKFFAKITEEDVIRIRKEYPTSSGPNLAKKYGICKQNVLNIVNRVAWKHVA